MYSRPAHHSLGRLGWLGAGLSEEQILDEHPDLEKADFPAVYQYAAETGRKTNLG
jgi:uncharacterized protein (DUF433 family)